GRGRTEVGLDDRHVRLFVRGKFLDLVGDPIDRVGRVTEFDAFDARGRDQRRGFLRDDADDGDLDTADVDDRVLLEAVGDVLCTPVVDIRAEVGEVGLVDDAPGEVVDTAVEFVVAHRRGLHADRIEHIECGRVVGRGRVVR